MSEDKSYIVDAEDDGIRLDRWFKRNLPEASFNVVSRWARTGQLRVDGARADPGDRVAAGQEIRIPPVDLAQLAAAAKPPRPRTPLSDDEIAEVRDMVIESSADAFVLNKPPGLASQGGTKTTRHLDRLLDGLAGDDDQRPKLVHRLDKDTSGVILIARSARAAGLFSKAFAGRTAKKVYWALVIGIPDADEGMIDAPLAKQPGSGGEKMHIDEDNGQSAKTRFRVIDRAGNRAAFVELQPLTGRTYQLRAHMAAIGHPIVGDAKYGGAEAFLTGGVSRKLHLHARRLKIDAPGGKKIDVKAELPPHFAESLEMLGFTEMSGDMMPLSAPQNPPNPKKKATAHAKAVRKERRGERRGRSGGGRSGGKPATRKTSSKGPTKGPTKGPPKGGAPRGRR